MAESANFPCTFETFTPTFSKTLPKIIVDSPPPPPGRSHFLFSIFGSADDCFSINKKDSIILSLSAQNHLNACVFCFSIISSC